MIPVVSHEVKTRRWPYVTICLIGLNFIVFVFELSMGPRFDAFLQQWGLVPARVNAEITVHNVATVFTSLFLHVGWTHLGFNMLFLLVLGDAVEDALGHAWYLALYLLSGFFGDMAFVATSSSFPYPAIGASGAIAGVMAASLVLWPRARLKSPGIVVLVFSLLIAYQLLVLIGVPSLLLGGPALFVGGAVIVVLMSRTAGGFVAAMFRGVNIPAWLVIGFWAGLQLWNGALMLVDPAHAGSVGWWAHVGGFAAGALLVWAFPKNPQELPRRALLE
jgi:membrane associated rhomboid family serine protease